MATAKLKLQMRQTMARYIGVSVIFLGMLELIPVIALPLDQSEQYYAPCFIFPGLAAMAVGYLVYFLYGKGVDVLQLGRREAGACALIVWVIAIGVYAVPFVLADLLDPFQAIFEATSGLTTTGLTVVNVEECPKIFILQRSLMHYFGGVGLVLVLTSVLSPGSGLRVYNIEGHTDRLLPGTMDTARTILVIYTATILIGSLAYWACGMSYFDAVNMAISAVSTGGFAVHSASIAYYNSFAIEAISVVLMLAGATNFLLNFLLLRGRFRAFASHIETRFFYGIIVFASLLVTTTMLLAGMYLQVPEALRAAVFQVVAVITTTGFQTIPSYALLPSSTLFVVICLMFAGSEAGSTAGGIKVYRLVVAGAGLLQSFSERYGHRRTIHNIKLNRFGKRVSCTREEMSSANMYVMIYVLLFVLGSFLFTLAGASVQDAVFDFASCLGNVGIGIGFITPNASPFVLLVGSAGMLLGRLEIIPVAFGVHWLLSLRRKKGTHA